MDPTLGFKVRDLARLFPNTFGFRTGIPSTSLVGAEFEIEGDKLPTNETMRYHWRVDHDGSLRGNSAEFVLKKPVSFKYFKEKSFPYLTKMIKKSKSKLKISGRCSTHIHVNVHELYLYQVWCMAALYYVYENIALLLAGTHRSGNLFCVGANNTEAIAEAMTATASEDVAISCCSDYKYAAVNFTSIGKYGSLEFRACRGTIDPKVVYPWVEFLLAIRKFCKSLSPTDIIELPSHISMTGPQQFLVDMLGRDSAAYASIVREVSNCNEDFSRLVYDGVRNIQGVFYDIPWDTLLAFDPEWSLEDYMAALKQHRDNGIMSDKYIGYLARRFNKKQYDKYVEIFGGKAPKPTKRKSKGVVRH